MIFTIGDATFRADQIAYALESQDGILAYTMAPGPGVFVKDVTLEEFTSAWTKALQPEWLTEVPDLPDTMVEVAQQRPDESDVDYLNRITPRG